LANNLEASEWHSILNEANKRKDYIVWLKIYMDVITRVNNESFKEIKSMSEWYIVELLEEMGALEDIKNNGETKVKIEIAQNMKNLGYTTDQIISATKLPMEKVEELI